MREYSGDNNKRVYNKAMAKKLKGQCKENLLLGWCLIGGSTTVIIERTFGIQNTENASFMELKRDILELITN
jgi:hypothetical protein